MTPGQRFLARLNRAGLNRVTRRLAPQVPGFGIIHHQGRRSGRIFQTPVNVFPTADGFKFALTYGADSDWVKNVLAAGSCDLTTRRTTFHLKDPRLVHDPSQNGVRPLERQVLRRLGIADFLVARREEQSPHGPHGAAGSATASSAQDVSGASPGGGSDDQSDVERSVSAHPQERSGFEKSLVGNVVSITGWACLLIGIGHLVGGSATVPGEAGTDATVDSRERFYGAIFCGYGTAWVWAARQQPIPAPLVAELCGIMALGGAGRLLSRATRGHPHWFQDVLTAIELVLPPAVLVMLTPRRGWIRSLTSPAPGSRSGRGEAWSSTTQARAERTQS